PNRAIYRSSNDNLRLPFFVGIRWQIPAGSVCCPPRFGPLRQPFQNLSIHQSQGTKSVKVIASSLRKGNIVDVDGKLYVIITAENIHPGKGTPVTQVDMRRLSDGVKSSQRYKTTEQVERAHVEDRPYQYLYGDNDGFH